MIKLIDNTARFEVICEQDDALIAETVSEMEAIRAAEGKSRYEQYLENLDESKLLIKEGEKPSKFVIRCLMNSETADLQSKHYKIDTVSKTATALDPAKLFAEYVSLGCIGLKMEDGSLRKIAPDDLEFAVMLSLGGVISSFTTMGKNQKKL